MFLYATNPDGSQEAFKIKTKRENERFGFDTMKSLGKLKPKKWDLLTLSSCKSHIKLVKSMMLMGSSFFVSFSK